jgi:single stranded DNA-binding protein
MYHKVLIVGNLGRDPEMRYTPDGTPVTNFSVATTRKWGSQDGTRLAAVSRSVQSVSDKGAASSS